MPDDSDLERLRAEATDLRARLAEAEATLDAIRYGEVDAVVVAGTDGHRVYSLEGADQFYRVLIEAMQPGQGAASLSTDGTVLYCNRSFAALLGVPQEKVGGRPFRRFVTSADHATWDGLLRDAQTMQSQGELRLRCEGHGDVPVHLAINALPLTGAVALGLVVTDLTERKQQEETARRLVCEEAARAGAELVADQARQAEAAVRESEARFRQLADALPHMVWMARADGHTDYYNERWYEFTGFPRGEFGDSSWVPMIHRDDVQRAIDTYYGCIRSGDVFQIEYRLRDSRTETFRWFLGRAYPVRDAAGRVVRWFGTCTDIDDLKKASERQRLLGEAASVLLTADEPDRMIRELFNRIAPHFGLDVYFNFMADEAANTLRLLSCVGIPDEAAQAISQLNYGQAVCGMVAISRRPIVVTEIQRSDDPSVQLVKSLGVRTYACNPLLAGSRLLGTLSFASRSRDRFADDELEFLRTISHYVTVAYERARLVRKLQETDRRKDEFLATLAHELRNPLAPIRNAAEVLKLKGGTDPNLKTARDVIDRQVRHLARLVDDLLDVSRIARGKIVLQRERLVLADMLTVAIEAAQPAISAAGHTLTVTIPSDPMSLDGDLTRLVQVFANLLVNAAKYTDRGGQIGLTALREGSDVAVAVSDNGIGIPPDHLPRLFEMFSQVDSALERTQGGLGIGLSLVKALVEMHGGRVEARSGGLGEGSTFLVRLPLLIDSVQSASAREGPTTRAPAPRRRVLVADDNPDSTRSLALMLTMLGHDVAAVHDGEAAVSLGAEFRPDAILLDIGMPRLNGYEAAQRIREKDWGRHVLLVAVTGWGQAGDKDRAIRAGFDFHFTKPVSPAALQNVLAGFRSGGSERVLAGRHHETHH